MIGADWLALRKTVLRLGLGIGRVAQEFRKIGSRRLAFSLGEEFGGGLNHANFFGPPGRSTGSETRRLPWPAAGRPF